MNPANHIQTKTHPYDRSKYDFRGHIAGHFGVPDLENLHQHGGVGSEVFVRATDQSSMWHKRFYQIGADFFATYQSFLREVVQPMFGEAIVYQKIPSFRAQFPNNVGVGEFHRDRDYAHNLQEINFWVPVTPAFDTNTIWIESQEGKEDFAPQRCEVGQVLVFNGCHLKHGNKINRTGQTRVSFDFRVIPRSKYSEADAGRSINTKVEFKIGGYYELLAL